MHVFKVDMNIDIQATMNERIFFWVQEKHMEDLLILILLNCTNKKIYLFLIENSV